MNLTLTDDQVAAIESLRVPGMPHEEMYSNPAYWIGNALGRCLDLGMNRGNQKIWGLDIGSAVPYFAWVAEKYEHDIVSMDAPDRSLIESARILGCEYMPHTITADSPLANLPHRFDLITMFGLGIECTANEYAAFSVRAFKQLVPGGRLIVAPSHGYIDNKWKRIAWWQKHIPTELATIEKRQDRITIQAR